MQTPHFLVRSGAILLAAALPLTTLRAGDDSAAARPASLSPLAQMNEYLEGQKITHSVETVGGDFKGDGTETLTVKIYGVAADTQQDAICTVLAATAKKGHVRETNVLFFASGTAAAGQQAAFQPSQLPGGNGAVEFPRESPTAGYRLLRTVKL